MMYRKMTAEELLERYADGERNFIGIELIKTKIFGRMNPQRCDLRGINLRGAYFEHVDLTKADLTGADLSNAFFRGGTLNQCIIRDANLMSIYLHGSNLYEADLRGSNLNYMTANLAYFDEAWFDPFEDATLMYTSFTGAKVSGKINYDRNLIYYSDIPDNTDIC